MTNPAQTNPTAMTSGPTRRTRKKTDYPPKIAGIPSRSSFVFDSQQPTFVGEKGPESRFALLGSLDEGEEKRPEGTVCRRISGLCSDGSVDTAREGRSLANRFETRGGGAVNLLPRRDGFDQATWLGGGRRNHPEKPNGTGERSFDPDPTASDQRCESSGSETLEEDIHRQSDHRSHEDGSRSDLPIRHIGDAEDVLPCGRIAREDVVCHEPG